MAKILIIEDEKALNDAYAIILRKEGHQITTAFNGAEALAAFKEDAPELILLDLRMPKMDGVQFLKRLDPAKKYPYVKIIIFSNYDEQKEIEEAFKYGADRYILKAWSSPHELIKLVDETLESPKSSA